MLLPFFFPVKRHALTTWIGHKTSSPAHMHSYTLGWPFPCSFEYLNRKSQSETSHSRREEGKAAIKVHKNPRLQRHKKSFVQRNMATVLPFKVEQSLEYGRHLVASMDIQPQTTVIVDAARVCVPGLQPVCLGCLGPLPQQPTIKCDSCGFPMCSTSCQNSPDHKDNECTFFSSGTVTVSVLNEDGSLPEQHFLYHCIGVLRTAIAMKKDNFVAGLQTHWEERLGIWCFYC